MICANFDIFNGDQPATLEYVIIQSSCFNSYPPILKIENDFASNQTPWRAFETKQVISRLS